MAELTPMMQQYLNIKKQYPNCILFFRLGDFYEMFFEDAKIASKELEIALTGRDCGLEERAPMCGVPFHAYEGYAAKLVSKGYKVAICEQTEDPSVAKGIVKREIIRIITPGTVLEGSMLDESRNNYLATACIKNSVVGICFADISTGEIHLTDIEENVSVRLCNEMSRFSPREILMDSGVASLSDFGPFLRQKLACSVELLSDDSFELQRAQQLILKKFEGKSLEEMGIVHSDASVAALGALLAYVESTQMNCVDQLKNVEYYDEEQYMTLDVSARRNLELTETMRSKDKKGSLLWCLDKTCTAMGRRLIRTWIEQPLISCGRITRRQNAVQELVENPILCAELAGILSDINDIERIMTRIVYGSANARELRSLAFAVERLPVLKAALSSVQSSELYSIKDKIDTLEDMRNLIEESIVEDPPVTVREGGIIKDGFDPEVDSLRKNMNGGKDYILDIERNEREKTGIPKLKIGYNRVFGYYIEISNSYKELVPEEYIRKQTLANCERYITQELKELEGRILGASGKVVVLEYQIFDGIRKKIAEGLTRVQQTAHAVAELDVLRSFAEVSAERGYVRPTVNVSGKIYIRDGRHPVIESILDEPFVPNDVQLDNNENRVAVITGPNMAGKSTYMRQAALIVLMAQIGCFVPASSAEIGIVDKIFTRVGASDDLSTGQSTFMVEMKEVADILNCATQNSLLVLDEIGRGTSTFDGMSIARAVLEYAADTKKLGAKTLFATHYHELTELESILNGVKNYNIAVKKRGDDITFLRRIIRGGADESYGIEVAKLAGIPDKIINRAKQILKELDSGQPIKVKGTSKRFRDEDECQMTFISQKENDIVRKLQEIDVNAMTPIEALGVLFELSKLAKE